jgi:MBOAT, membrane-bound O-acyltransferase family
MMSTAGLAGVGRVAVMRTTWPVVRQKLLSLMAISALWLAAPVLGLRLSGWSAALLAVGAVAVEAWPTLARQISVAVAVALLAVREPRYAALHLALVGAVWVARRRTATLALTLVTGAVVLPKAAFSLTEGRALADGWLDPASLAALIFITLYWWREACSARAPAGGATSWGDWCALFLVPFHPVYPVAFGPNDLWRSHRVDTRLVLGGALGCVAKAGTLAGLRRLFPGAGYADLSAAALLAMPAARLWAVVGLNYLELVLLLSGLAEAGILVARLYGWPLPSPFRFALLAWNPVELWRRWGIYTRRILLKTVYFPLGGGERHRFRNVMLTFLASAVIFHSGWLGSPYWTVGEAGWRDHALYFGLQGLGVCSCLALWQRRGKDPRADRALRWSPARLVATAATQAFSAWAHILILVPSVPLTGRLRLMARCLGF